MKRYFAILMVTFAVGICGGFMGRAAYDEFTREHIVEQWVDDESPAVEPPALPTLPPAPPTPPRIIEPPVVSPPADLFEQYKRRLGR